MYVDRTLKVTTKPWEAGGFGFVRDPIRFGEDVVLTKFHEGVDICPMACDKAGNLLDSGECRERWHRGLCVHIGRALELRQYVVVEHKFDGDTFYSVYAHLADVSVKPGDAVRTGLAAGPDGIHR